MSNAASATPNMRVAFYGNDQHSTAAGTQVALKGDEEFLDEFTRVVGNTRTYLAHVGGLVIPFVDEDDSGEFHLTVTNESATNITQTRVWFNYFPSYPA